MTQPHDYDWLLRGAVRCWEDMKARFPDDEDRAIDGLQRACIVKCGDRTRGLSLAIDAIYAGPRDAVLLATPVGRH